MKTKTFSNNIWSMTIFAILTCFNISNISSQNPASLTLEGCYSIAKENYPANEQKDLIQQSKNYTLENLSKLYFPQISIISQISYQSDVTKIPISIPGFETPIISKDQYKFYGELYQPLTDILSINKQKDLIKSNAESEGQRLEVELYKIRERIHQIYFGILLIDAQIQLTELLKKDIQAGINKINAAIANGMALKSNEDQLKAELLKADQRTVELMASRKGFIQMLSLFMNSPIDDRTTFLIPEVSNISTEINRPELNLFDLQKKSLDVQNKILTTKTIPRLGVFFQGGYGNPALNFLKDGFEPYYIGGLRFNWNISAYYTIKKERKLLQISQSSIDIQKNTFKFNTNMLLTQQNAEIEKFQTLTKTDQEIIILRENVKNSALGQWENGTLTTNDYLIYVNAMDLARQNLSLHQLQLLMAQYNYLTTSGN